MKLSYIDSDIRDLGLSKVTDPDWHFVHIRGSMMKVEDNNRCNDGDCAHDHNAGKIDTCSKEHRIRCMKLCIFVWHLKYLKGVDHRV